MLFTKKSHKNKLAKDDSVDIPNEVSSTELTDPDPNVLPESVIGSTDNLIVDQEEVIGDEELPDEPHQIVTGTAHRIWG